jgi:hypothetical protein
MKVPTWLAPFLKDLAGLSALHTTGLRHLTPTFQCLHSRCRIAVFKDHAELLLELVGQSDGLIRLKQAVESGLRVRFDSSPVGIGCNGFDLRLVLDGCVMPLAPHSVVATN